MPHVKDYGAHPMHHIDKGLSCVPAKITNHLNLVLSRENILDQRDELMRKVVVTD